MGRGLVGEGLEEWVEWGGRGRLGEARRINPRATDSEARLHGLALVLGSTLDGHGLNVGAHSWNGTAR